MLERTAAIVRRGERAHQPKRDTAVVSIVRCEAAPPTRGRAKVAGVLALVCQRLEHPRVLTGETTTFVIDPSLELRCTIGHVEAGKQVTPIEVDGFREMSSAGGFVEGSRVAPERVSRDRNVFGAPGENCFGP